MKNQMPVEILLVEDNPNDAELTLNTLESNKLVNHVAIAQDGAEALDFIFCRNKYVNRTMSDQPKVILLDLKLPKVDGLEVIKAIKADLRTQMIPIVVLTSSREERDIIESYKLGVNSYMVKPIDFAQFTNSVREIGLYWMLQNVVSR